MNRIILIGNGFDLAHGMNTSYNHFLKDYWKKIITQLQHSAANNATSLGKTFENKEIEVDGLHGPWGKTTKIEATNFEDLLTSLKSQNSNLSFKNKFLEILTKKQKELNWVDIEIEYYELLKKSFNYKEKGTIDYTIEKLNGDFESVKNLLKEYLIRVENEPPEKFHKRNLRNKHMIGEKVYSPFMLRDFSESTLNQKAEQEYSRLKNSIEELKKNELDYKNLSPKDKNLMHWIDYVNPRNSIKELLLSEKAYELFNLKPDNTLFLNFNYTYTDTIYHNPKEINQVNDGKYSNVESIHIHGSSDERDKNPIIFGFGDELDEDYKAIEKLNNNKYLENIKSIKYLETDNYKKLLEFMNSNIYQVFIFGHSCSTSDRTLLNTLFEHDNCSSIKLFYHQRDENLDNFSDIIRNISRNFNDKVKMRDRVVNKTYSESLN